MAAIVVFYIYAFDIKISFLLQKKFKKSLIAKNGN